tara:strand:- start:136 stop:714 length:579 start_codon:yes stop_codon:yes gene_type:complete
MFRQISKNSICLFIILFMSCQNSSNSSNEISVSNTEINTKTSYNNDILGQYLRIKDALISSDMEKINIAAESLLKVLWDENKVGIQNLNQSDEESGDLKIDQLKKITQNILDANDIQIKRKSFFELSQIIYDALQNKSLNSNVSSFIFLQYCPMAFNNSGGVWLSSEHEISNPYFGDMMLTCGVVRDTIRLF